MYKDKQAREVSVNSIFPKAKETIANMDGDIAVINNPNSMLVLVNKSRRLPDGYRPPDLVIPKVRYSSEGDQEEKMKRGEGRLRICFSRLTTSVFFFCSFWI